MCQIAYRKPVYLQIYTDFCPWYFQTIKSDRLHHIMSCIIYIIQTNDQKFASGDYTLQLVTRRWPEDFLILSPVLWNLKLFEVCPGSHKNCFFGVISHNLWRNLETNLERIPSKGRCGYFLELHSGFIYCLREGRGGCGGVRSDIQERSQVVFNW